ncbi:hypothetical protein BCR33DRAFT_716825 [Rhizoclosmatium globosum]|uniref:NodB homology domain-containing protein n=1 Tax=Rhizoclosmatium globosum TaxID=329046 RepID=A0A1Y2CCX9_9FUNG|nr:hypothetical protein BCR33DRAFT_716825 [Rhizoclosmatium globosum]|eukprot:ORY44900.1 hypothetical protein BCR33DRAFT_716825 [Rhizoclosmatium globosum]
MNTYRILGFVPRYMRPPFGAGLQTSTVTGILKNMGYVIVGWSLDTVDATIDDENPYQFNTPHLLSDAEYLNATVTRIKAQISGLYNPGGAYIALEHDVYNMTGWVRASACRCLFGGHKSKQLVQKLHDSASKGPQD